MALLAAIAEVRPEAIEQMVKPSDDGTFTVSFFGPDGKRVNQTVTPTFPSYSSGDPAYAKLGDQSEVYGKELWPMLIEKAWMQAHGSWLGIEGGKVNTKQHAIGMTGSDSENLPLPGTVSEGGLVRPPVKALPGQAAGDRVFAERLGRGEEEVAENRSNPQSCVRLAGRAPG